MVFNRSYQNAWKRRSRGVDQIVSEERLFYRPAKRTAPGATARRPLKRPGRGFVPLQGEQLELDFAPKIEKDPDKPLADIFPEAYED